LHDKTNSHLENQIMINLIPLDDTYIIYQLNNNQEIPSEIFNSGFYSITKTSDEISIISNCKTDFNFLKSSKGWKGYKVDGILDFSLVGIISDITKPLKDNEISVFVISTFNTDYIFIKEDSFDKSMKIFNLTDNIKIRNK
jgi:hypothetical protein